MELFSGRYLTEEEIWQRIENIIAERKRIEVELAKPEVSTDFDKMPALAKKLDKLKPISELALELKEKLNDLEEAEELMAEQKPDEEVEELYQIYKEDCQQKAEQLYQLLIDEGYLEEETEEETDLEILKFIEYVGPEYAWRLGINLDLETAEARERLQKLVTKGLLERVQGTMLKRYHREEDWGKHMNHTYYNLSRKGKLYLRNLKRNSNQLDEMLAKFD